MPALRLEVLSRPAEQLARRRLGGLQDVGDPLVGVVQRLAQHVRGALGGRELLEQDEDRVLQRLAALGAERRVVLGVDGFRQPGADVRLPARVGRLQDVDRQAGGDRRKERSRLEDALAVGGLPADPDLLEDVLRIRDRAEHPVGDAEQSTATLLEGIRRSAEVRVRRVDRHTRCACLSCRHVKAVRGDSAHLLY